MNNNIFIHLGLAKTASTFLQQGVFSKHSEINYLGKNLVDEELHKAGQKIVRNKPNQYKSSEVEYQFIQAIKRGEDKKVHVYSEEDLSVFKFLHPNICASRLQKIFTNYNAFLFIREPLSWIDSQYYFRLSTYRVDTLEGFVPWLTKHFQNFEVGSDIAEIKYSQLINIYENKLGNGLLKVYLYEEFKNNPKYMLQNIGDFMGINQDELIYLNEQRSQQVKDKERMTVALADFIKNANFLVKDDLDSFKQNLETYLALIPAKRNINLLDLFQQIEKLFSDKITDLETWKPILHKIAKLLTSHFASSPKAEEKIPDYLKQRILEISLEENEMIFKKWNLPLKEYGYLLPKKISVIPHKNQPLPEKESITKTKHDSISTKVIFSLQSEKLITTLKKKGIVNYLELASSLKQDGLLSKDQAIAMERRKILPKWLLEELSPEIKESEQIEIINIYPFETIKTQPPQCLYEGPLPKTLTPKFVKSPSTNVTVVEKGKFWLENFQKIILLEGQNYYNWDSSANVSWLVPIISSLKPEHFSGKVAVMISPGASLFSHWLFDLMPKFELLFTSGYQIDDIDYFLINLQKNSYHWEMLQKLGIPKNKIVYQTENLNFISADTLIIPSPIRYSFYTPKWAINFLQNLLINKRNNLKGGEKTKFYISRSKAKRRRILNEDDIKVVLKKFNYQTVYAEDYNINEFASLMSQASAFVSPHGAGLSNILFTPSATPVLEIFGPHIAPEGWLLSQSCNLKYHILSGKDEKGLFPWQDGAFPYENFQQKNGYDFFVDPQQLENALATLENLIEDS